MECIARPLLTYESMSPFLLLFLSLQPVSTYLNLLSPFLEVSEVLEDDQSNHTVNSSTTSSVFSILGKLWQVGNTKERPGREAPMRTRARQPLPFMRGDYAVDHSLSSKERRQQTGYTEVWAIPTKMPKMATPRYQKPGILTAVISSLLGPGRPFLQYEWGIGKASTAIVTSYFQLLWGLLQMFE